MFAREDCSLKNIFKSVLIITITVIICTAFVGCRRNNKDDSSSGMMSDVNSVASDVVSNVESGMHGMMQPSSSNVSGSSSSVS